MNSWSGVSDGHLLDRLTCSNKCGFGDQQVALGLHPSTEQITRSSRWIIVGVPLHNAAIFPLLISRRSIGKATAHLGRLPDPGLSCFHCKFQRMENASWSLNACGHWFELPGVLDVAVVDVDVPGRVESHS